MENNRQEPEARIQHLAKSFPCLQGAPGISPWQPIKLDDWAASGKPSHGEIVTAQFLLAVWNSGDEWKAGRFDLMEALAVCDLSHHRAFLHWAIDPWWP
jgi:hypothetical protein